MARADASEEAVLKRIAAAQAEKAKAVVGSAA
jgi:hypothetical protein